MQAYEQKIVDKLVSRVTKTTAAYIYLDGGKISKSKFKEVIELFDLINVGYPSNLVDSKEKFEKIRSELANTVIETVQSNKIIQSNLGESFETIDPTKYETLVDLSSGHKYVFSHENKAISRMNPASFELICKLRDLKPSYKFCVIEYNPYAKDVLYPINFDGQDNIMAVNTYIPPSWMQGKKGEYIHTLSPEEIEGLTCPSIIDEFLHRLLPDEISYNFVLAWMHNALVSRCQTYLLLNGKKGIGKNIFAENLMAALVDDENHKMSPISLLDSQFNAALENCRILVADEIQAKTGKQVDRLKRYLNDIQNIEKKGVDANNNTRVYFSAVLLNNRIDDIYLTQDDRRYSVPVLTADRLDLTWGEEKINELLTALQDPEVVEQFGYWVLHKCKRSTVTPNTALKSAHFYKMCYASLSKWKQVTVECCLESESNTVTVAHIRKTYNKEAGHNLSTNARTISRFLEEYLHEGVYKIGDIVEDYDTNKKVIELSQDFIEFRDKLKEVKSKELSSERKQNEQKPENEITEIEGFEGLL